MTVIINAVKMCENKRYKQIEEVENIYNETGERPKFMIINASDDEGNTRYIKGKVTESKTVGIDTTVHKFEKDCTTEDILKVLCYCKRNKIPVIVQKPIFEHLDEKVIFDHVVEEIDADGFNAHWIGKTFLGEENISPATPRGVMDLLSYHDVTIDGKVALIIGRSNHVGKPIATMLTNRGATIMNANSKTKDLPSLVNQADIVVSCAGKVNLIDPKDIKENAIVVGVGFTYIDGKQILDFDVDEVVKDGKALLVTNRIKCTGKATVSALIDNVIDLYNMNYMLHKDSEILL